MESKRTITYEANYEKYCKIRDQIEAIKTNPLGITHFVVYEQLYRKEYELDTAFPEGENGLRESLDKTYELTHKYDISTSSLQVESDAPKALQQTIEFQRLIEEKEDLRSSHSDNEIIQKNLRNIDLEMHLLIKAYKENEEKEKSRYFTEKFLNDSEDLFQPFFYLMLVIYRYLKTVWTFIPEAIDKIISYFTMGIGKAFNLLYIFHLWRDSTTPQRTIKTVNALFNFLAAIANITTTALKTNPYAQGIISFTSIMLSLYKDSRSVNATLNEIEADENELAKLKRLQEKLKKDNKENILLAQLPSKIKFYEKKIAEKNKSNRFDNIRSLIFTSINAFFGLGLLASSIVLAWPQAFPAMAPDILSAIAYVALSIQLPLTILDISDQYYGCPVTRWISNNQGICGISAMTGLSVGSALSYYIFAGAIVPMILGGIAAGVSLVVGTYSNSVVSNKNVGPEEEITRGTGTDGIAKKLGFSPSPDRSRKNDNRDPANSSSFSRTQESLHPIPSSHSHSRQSGNLPSRIR